LRAEFDHHKTKDFVAVVERVSTLEKKITKLST